MLKKHLNIVENIEKLTRFTENRFVYNDRTLYLTQSCIMVRGFATRLLEQFKVIVKIEFVKMLIIFLGENAHFQKIMKFNGNNEWFMRVMQDSNELFNQLTAHLTDEQKQELTVDPGNFIIILVLLVI